ncbi:MAG: DMT family transporter [Erythrobacter sp.]|nr:DMT family transporter [Erythrobacter sp.]
MRTILLACLAVLAFAANSLTARAALADAANDPFAFALVRIFAGAFILIGLLKSRPTIQDLPGSLALAIYMFGFAAAYTAMSTATGALILFSAVQITILVVSSARGEPIRKLAVLGCGIALGGLTLLLYSSLASAPVVAVSAMLAAGVAWGFYTVLGRGSEEPIQQTGRQFVLASFMSLPAFFAIEPTPDGSMLTMQGVLLAVASGAIFSGLGYAVWYTVSPRLPAATTASVQLMTPVVAAGMGAAFLGEAIEAAFLVATLIILAGIALTLTKPKD